MIFSSLTLAAQEVKIVESLSDNSFIVQIEGKNYRALSPERMKEIQETYGERDLLKSQLATTQDSYTMYKVNSARALASQTAKFNFQVEKDSNTIQFWQDQYKEEKDLRERFQNRLGTCWRIPLVPARLCLGK